MKRQIKLTIVITLLAAALLSGCTQKAEPVTNQAAVQASNHLYMDVHKNIDGLTAEAVAGAHQKDLEVQEKYGVNYLRYWYDESSGTVFCLVDAPSAEMAAQVHKEAHGLVADEIIEVDEGR